MYLLDKYVYGLKMSENQRYCQIDEFIMNTTFVRSGYDNCVYIEER